MKKFSHAWMKFTFVLLLTGCISMWFSHTGFAAQKISYRIGLSEKVKIKSGYKGNAKKYQWRSSDSSVAAVSSYGNVKGKKLGKATIFRYSSDGSRLLSSYKIVVKKAPKKLYINQKNLTLYKNCTTSLQPQIKGGYSYHGCSYTSSDKKIAIVNKNGVITGKAAGTAFITAKTYNGKKQRCIVTVKAPKKVVGLSFDDGPAGENTARLLTALRQYDCHATFFMVGYMVAKNKSNLCTMVKDGHELGIHTWDHQRLTSLAPAKIEEEISSTAKIIQKTCGKLPTVVRPPYGSYDDKVLSICKKQNYPVILWNIDTRDWQTSDSNVVKNNILSQVKDGAILLLHDSHPSSVQGFIDALPVLKEQGYEFVTISDMAAIKGVSLKPGENFYGTKTFY